MNTLKAIRLGLWGTLLTASLIICSLYVAINHTFLSEDSLNKIVADSDVTETVREEVLLPKVLQTTRASIYASLLDDKTVVTAFNQSISTDVLNKKLEPAVAATQQWLNNQAESINFTIDMSDLSDAFAASLAKEVNAKLASLPRCTIRNTLTDAERGLCRSALISTETLTQKITELVTSDRSLAGNRTLTPDTVQLSPAIKERGSNLPDYLNMFYAFALVSAGIAAIVTVWLLIKHRFSGVTTIGISSVFAALSLFIISIVGTQMIGVLSADNRVQQIARTGASVLESTLQQYALGLGIVGILLCVLGAIFIIARRRRGRQTVRFEKHV